MFTHRYEIVLPTLTASVQDCFRFNIPSGGQVARAINVDIASSTPIVIASGRPTLRRVLQGIVLIMALFFSLAVPYFVAGYLVGALLREEYDWAVKVTVTCIRWCIGSVELYSRFAHSVYSVALSKFE